MQYESVWEKEEVEIETDIAAALTYPVYSYFFKRKREKIAPEIIRLTDELLK